jgi:shikimate kinase
MKFSRIFLVGFMGAGKSTVGPLLANRLGWKFVDLDQEIENRQKRSIQEIFENAGEPYFRSVETAAIKSLEQRSECVVALGGGAFARESNRSLIHRLGVSVFLDCSLEKVLDRCPIDGTRPLFKHQAEIQQLYQKRLPHYQCSNLRIDVSTLKPDKIADLIVNKLLLS